MESAKELLEHLNNTDECAVIEAKRGRSIDRSILESVCAFANEPGLGGGYLLLGVEKDESSLFPYYIVTGIEDNDKLQLDLATQCATIFNQPIRPEIEFEKLTTGIIMKIFIQELQDGQKPLYFKNEGLPRGAYRRIGSSDQRCTDDDLFVFYNKEDSLDSTTVHDTTSEDCSDEAIELYRNLRARVNQYAEELTYSDDELLFSLGCQKKERKHNILTYTGLLVFGKRQSLRRVLPMVRVDYIRIPGNEWAANPDNRFTTIDMRGPMIELVQRTFSAIADDLPKGFLLPDGEIQAESIGLPSKVVREAIVNAFMHRSYRVNQPIQIIRYGNRIEIKNPGFSLKPEEDLGDPGSRNRNPFIAAIFHETNLAETKGSGIRTMRALMEKANMAPPTFESDHGNNQFTTRLLLHHFLNEEDIRWLRQMANLELTDPQKRGLIFLRETGALDNSSYRQINGCDVLKASTELRNLRDLNLLEQKGKGRYTYYIPGPKLPNQITVVADQTTEPDEENTEPIHQNTEDIQTLDLEGKEIPIPGLLKAKIDFLGKKAEREQLETLILELCQVAPFSPDELGQILNRQSNHLYREYIRPLREAGLLQYTIPEMPNHPKQQYVASIPETNSKHE